MPYPSLPAYQPDKKPPPPPVKVQPVRQVPLARQPQLAKEVLPQHSAKIQSWDHQKGYGFLRHGKKGLFLHWRDFAEHHKKPMPGDLIRFAVGKDPQGRTCAVQARHHNDGGGMTLPAAVALGVCLILPGLALYRFHHISGIHAGWVLGAAFLISVTTYSRYASDKNRARSKSWRISEANLHFMELIAGWPGAFIAQKRLRHKCSKASFLAVFWVIVMAYQFLAFDYLRNWQASRALFESVSNAVKETPSNTDHYRKKS